MKALPDSEIYEEGLEYWPYKLSWKKVLEHICETVPRGGTLVDVMCGPGYLLGKVATRRKDLALTGVDIDKRYIPHAREKYPDLTFVQADILKWDPQKKYDTVVCTGALHHISYLLQEAAVQRMASLVKADGCVLIADCYVDDYSNETERKIAAAKLGYEYLQETINNGASKLIIQDTIEILWNDVLMKEFKTSLQKRLPVLERAFRDVKTEKMWPHFESAYGDYVSVCRGVRRA